MRTATHFFQGKGTEEFVKIFRVGYPAGKVVIVTDDTDLSCELVKKLGSDYNVLVYGAKDVDSIARSEAARYFIGVGTPEVIVATKRAASGVKFAFYPTVYDYRYLHDFEGERSLPEFVFLDEKILFGENYACRLYVTLFQLYSEICFRLFYDGVNPYKDKSLDGVRGSIKKLLSGEEDRAVYFSDGIRLTAVAVNELYLREVGCFVTEKSLENIGFTLGDRFAAVYFADLLLINFTKHRFRDILLPSERFVGTGKDYCAEAFNAAVLPTAEELAFYASKVKYLTEIPSIDIKLTLNALKNAAEGSELFSIINRKGIFEGLQGEGLI